MPSLRASVAVDVAVAMAVASSWAGNTVLDS